MHQNKIEFLHLQERHIPFLRRWLKEPHVAQFWQETENEEEFRQKFLIELPERSVSPFIIVLDSTPVGYIQCYDASKVGGGWWPDAKEGTFGIDQFIGEPSLVGKGLGTIIIKQFVNELFLNPSVVEVIADPDPQNKRAVRVYEKVGFAPVGEIKTPGGQAFIMRMQRPNAAATNQQRPSPYDVAQELFETRFKGAELVFVAGSIRRNEATISSDIDLVVVYSKLEQPYRESLIHKGWPVECFVHDPETLNYFILELNVKEGVPSLLSMVVEGQAIPDPHPLANQLKSLADRVLNMGPPKYSEEQLIGFRYGISDLLDDLRSPKNDFEQKAILAKLHEQLGNFWFRAQGRWSASGKHIPRRMQKLDPAFAQQWTQAFDAAFLGKASQVIALAEKILSSYGGCIFEGFRSEAPKEWRKALPLPKDPVKNLVLLETQSGLQANETVLSHKQLGKIGVRLVKTQDVQKLRVLLNSAYKKLADMGLNFNATFQDDELTADGLVDGRTFILEQGDQLIGTMKIRNFNSNEGRPYLYVSRFAVRPDLQGHGLGLFLLNLAEKIAKREGFFCMQLDTAQPAEHLIKFYQNYGFQIIRPIYYEGKTYCSWILEKRL